MKSEKLAKEIAVEQERFTLAQELHDIEHDMAFFEARAKLLRTELLKTLVKQGVRRVDLLNGDSYVVYPRNKLVIKNEISAQKWWMENPEARGKMDTAKAMEVALNGKLKWCKVEKDKYLRISRAK